MTQSNVIKLTPDFTVPEDEDGKSKPLSASTLRMGIYTAQALCDILAIILAFAAVLIFNMEDTLVVREAAILLYVMPTYLAMALYRQAYAHDTLTSLQQSWSRAIIALALAAGVLIAAAAGLKVSAQYSRFIFVTGIISSAALIMLFRAGITWFVNNNLRDRIIAQLLIRDGMSVDAPHGYNVLDAAESGLKPDINNPKMLHFAAAHLAHYDRVVVACDTARRTDWSTVLKGLGVNGEIVVPELSDVGLLRDHRDPDWTTLQVSCGPLSMRNRILKRIFDLAVTIPLLIVLAVPLVIVSIIVALDSGGPIFFRQPRVGRHNRMFNVLKFRSMYYGSTDSAGNQSTAIGDGRITRIGKFIRATSIDELPQLFNVITGDMSLVGPRPHALGSRAADQLFWEVDAQYWTRHAVKPGITGLAQVRGFRGATHELTDLTDRLQADLEYLSGWTLWRDFVILLKTAVVIVHPRAF